MCLSTQGGGVPPRAGTPGSRHPPEQTPSPRSRPPGETATAADGTHPTGMHSCVKLFLDGDGRNTWYGTNVQSFLASVITVLNCDWLHLCKRNKFLRSDSLPVADSGFSWRGGVPTPKVGVLTYFFWPKTAWKWKNLDREIPWRPP